MNLKQLYATVQRLIGDISEGRFVALYNLSIIELLTEYGARFVLKEDSINYNSGIKSILDEAACYPEYDSCIINNIIYLDDGSKTINKEISISQRKDAYVRIWNKRKKYFTKPRVWE